MKKFTKIMSAAVLAAASLSLSGCQDEDFGFDAKEISYHKNFTELFGQIDPNQTWSTAARRSVSIELNLPNGDETYQAKIWTADPSRKYRNLYYMADVTINNGETSSITIDAPSDLATVYVSLTDQTGGTIFVPATFSSEGKATAKFVATATRAAGTIEVLKYGDTGWESHLPAGSDGWGYFTADKYDAYRAVFPENGGNTDNPPCESFVFQSDGSDIILYPFYSVTGNYTNDEIGFYVYNPAEGEDFEAIVSDPNNYYKLEKGEGIWESKNAVSKGNITPYTNFVPSYANESLFTDKDIRTRPFIISGVPAGYRIIFALTNGEGPKFTVKELNKPDASHVNFSGSKDSRFVNGNSYSMAGSATLGSNQYLAFEDTWASGQYDCQDMAFTVYGGKMVDLNTGSGSAMGFMVAYEDLGNTFDMDFNDIVIKVSHVAHTVDGNSVPEDATVTLLAAGGTMHVVPKYKTDAIFANCGYDTDGDGEAHAVFGCDVDDPVNVGLTSAAAVSATISCMSNDAISDIAAKITMELTSTSDMEFTRKVSYCIDGSDRTSKIPYAILIASPSWEWPTELTTITTVYPDFKTWVSDASASNWYDASWDGGTADTGDHIGVLSGNTFFESNSILNIASSFVNLYTTEGTTLYFVFDGYTANSEVVIKAENGQFTKSTTMGTDGKASIELSGEEFSKILYKDSDTRATFFTITAYATSYGVSFGTEIDDVNGTDLNNGYSNLLASDGTKATITTSGDYPFLSADQLKDYSSVVLTIKTYGSGQYDGLSIKSPFADYSEITCSTGGILSAAMVPVTGRDGIYRITLSTEQLSKYTCAHPTDASKENGIIFVKFQNLEVAISGEGKATPTVTVPASLDLTDGETSQLSPTNTGNGTSYTYSSDNTAVASVDASGLITAGTTAGTANITVTVAGTDTHRSASATVTVNVTVDSRTPSDLAVANATKTMTVEDEYTLVKGTDFTTSSTGAITYSSNNEAVAIIDENGKITAISAGTAVITIADAGDTNYKKGTKTITVTVNNQISPDPDHTTTIDAATLGTNYNFDKSLFTSSERIDITITLEESQNTNVYFLVDNSSQYTNVLSNSLGNYSAYVINQTTTYTITNADVLTLLKSNGCKYDTNNMNNNNNVGNIKSVTITNYK